MVIKDLCCSVCGGVHEEMVDIDVGELEAHCEQCKTTSRHTVVCNGGLGVRWRCLDWVGVDFSHDVRVTGLSATTVDNDGNMIEDKKRDGTRCTAKFTDEHRLEHREKINYTKRRKRGAAPIYMYVKN